MKSACLKGWLLIVSFLISATVWSQVQKISGKITSSDDNKPLPGVSIIIKGKTVGTQTNINGEFSIDVSQGEVLVFSITGFTTREVKVGANTTIDLSLETKVSELDAVVVTGYGTQKRKEVTGAVVTVNPKTFEHSPSTNVATVLQEMHQTRINGPASREPLLQFPLEEVLNLVVTYAALHCGWCNRSLTLWIRY
jgi:hypothetical protein